MKCEAIQERFAAYLSKHLMVDDQAALDQHLESCDACKAQLEQAREVWQQMAGMPELEPSEHLRPRFYAMLEQEKMLQGQSRSFRVRLEDWLVHWWPNRPVAQFAFAVVFLIAGLVGGNFMGIGEHRNGELSLLHNEIQDMRQTVSISLMSQTSSAARLKGVGYSQRVNQPDDALLNSLLNTLNNDPNVNVRLAAVDALLVFSQRPGVRDALVASLSEQSSPMVQISLIDLLVQIQEKKSLDALRQLIQDQEVNPVVKEHAEKSLQDLI